MHTLKRFLTGIEEIPSGIAWYLADIAEAKGKQELFKNQSSQKLKVLREHALIESAVSSNRIEGIEIDRKRIGTVMFLLQLYCEGYEVGRYISLERLIEEHKERYYETLEISSQNWHENKHDPWPYINFLLYLLKKAYSEFEESAKKSTIPKGGKTELVISQIKKFKAEFTLSQLQEKCPNVSKDMIRKILKDLQKNNKIKSEGRGLGARWFIKGNTLI